MTDTHMNETPSHVARERIRDVDVFDLPGAGTDVHRAWVALAGGHDIIWTPRNGGHWIATGGDLILKLFRGDERFSNREVAVPAGSMLVPTLPIQADGEAHKAYRALIEPAFRPAAIQAYARRARELTVEIIERLKPQGRCDFTGDYAAILPLVIFLQIVDLPEEDRERLHRHTRVMTHEPDLAKRHEAFRGVAAYLQEKITERRISPGDDLLSKVIHGKALGRPLNEQEVLGMTTLLLFGGLDTVASMMSFVMKFLAEHPAHRQWIIDNPGRSAFAVEEIMRRYGVSQLMRTALVDTELDGAAIRAGDLIMLPTSLHGLDPREFDDPLEVDFERRAKPSATFGAGAHRCPGASLARLEMQIMVEEWLHRIPDMGIDPTRPLVQRSGLVNGILELPLRWHAADKGRAAVH